MRYLIITLSIFYLCSCRLGPDYAKPEIKVVDTYHAGKTDIVKYCDVEKDWWKSFKDPVLNNLIDDAIKHNHDIKIALASINEAKALRGIKEADFLPDFEASASASREGVSKRAASFIRESERNIFNADLDASWELDFFGKRRRYYEVSKAELEAAMANQRDVILTVIAELVRNYYEARGTQKQLATLYRGIALLKELETIAKAKYDAGSISKYDLAQARAERQNLHAQIPSLEATLHTTIYRISVLTGTSPETHLKRLKKHKPSRIPKDKVKVGLKSTVLRNRPDIAKAERELAASSAAIGASIAELFPSFSLAGTIGRSAALYKDLYSPDATKYAFGPLLNWSILDLAGYHNINVAKARNKSALLRYEKTVLEAIEDVESSLITYAKEWQRLKRLRNALYSRQQAYNIAKSRYEAGEEDFQVLIDAERSLITAKEAVIASETTVLSNLTQLYKSMGGGWS